MKKLIVIALLVAFSAVGCTNQGIEDDYEIQIIDKEQTHSPIDKKKDKDEGN